MILDMPFPPDPRVENEAMSLIKAGHEVYLFCLKYSETFSDEEVIDGIQVRRYLSNKLTYKLSALAYTFPFYRRILAPKIKDFIIKNRIEALHIHDMQVADAVFDTNRKLGLPTVLDLHENRPEIMKHYPHINTFPGRFLISVDRWRREEIKLVEKTDKVVVVTEEAKSDLLQVSTKEAKDIISLPNTVHKSFYASSKIDNSFIDRYKDDFVILYLGNTGWRRGIQTAIQALPSLKQTISNIKLVVVGKSSEDEQLYQLASDLGVLDCIDFEGWQDFKTFQSYIASSDVCISPLLINKHHDTTYANKLFQYMSFSKPILVSNVLAQENLIDNYNCGLVHNAEDVADFEAKLIELYQSPELRKELGNNGAKVVDTFFNWDIVGEKLVAMYRELKQ